MVLTYATYASGAFNLALATRSAPTAAAAFFVLHVPLLWARYGTGRVGEYEYLVYYPLVACAAALLGFLFAGRMARRAVLDWLRRPCDDCSHHTQWALVARHAVCVALLIVAPALPLELYVSNTFVGGIVSLLVALLAHLIYWAATRCDIVSVREAIAHRTAALWAAIIDIGLLRLGYTIVHMLWPSFRYTTWPFFVEAIAVGVALLPTLLVLEFCCLRAGDCDEADCDVTLDPSTACAVPAASCDGVRRIPIFQPPPQNCYAVSVSVPPAAVQAPPSATVFAPQHGHHAHHEHHGHHGHGHGTHAGHASAPQSTQYAVLLPVESTWPAVDPSMPLTLDRMREFPLNV